MDDGLKQVQNYIFDEIQIGLNQGYTEDQIIGVLSELINYLKRKKER